MATVTHAVPAEAMFAASTVAVSCSLLTKDVGNAEPFQLTVAAGAKPVPLTVSVNVDPPGAALVGTRGWLIKGTGMAEVPVRLIDCGLFRALSVIVTAALLFPDVFGEKVTYMVQ